MSESKNSMKLQKTTEGKAFLWVPVEKKISKELPVFYNPVMKHNRDISILLLAVLGRKGMNVCLPLAGSGVRGIRFMKELPKDMVGSLVMNDKDEFSAQTMKKNLALNKIKSSNIKVMQKNANVLLLEGQGMDYIDIDPFGTPNPFLDAGVAKTSRNGILAVTATDTSSLCGTYPAACKRKYWADTVKHPQMHETGLRVLIRKCQLVGGQYERALLPVFSYSKDHYMRVFFLCERGKEKVDKILSRHGMYNDGKHQHGPLWLDKLLDSKLTDKIKYLGEKMFPEDKELNKFLRTIANESKINTVGFHDIHSIFKKNRLPQIPKFEKIISELKKKKFQACQTHFTEKGIRSDVSEKELTEILSNL
ncbi:hypothetical protein JW868_00860 [Candidatus Woesearchaeota archaeon]|nr:hypothetical protein [Candidatus Woesearchaeota archaeon]